MNKGKPAPEGAGSQGSVGSRPEESPPNLAGEQARNPIDKPPEHGIHRWMMRAAWQGKKSGLSADETVRAMYAHEEGARRSFQAREVEDAVEKAFSEKVPDRGGVPDRRVRKQPAPKVSYNPEAAERVVSLGLISWTVLCALSPVIKPWELEPTSILRMLFAPDETLVCAGRSQRNFTTQTLLEHGDLSGHQFVVPAPMSARSGRTKMDPTKRSAHTLDNTGPRVFNVFDFDEPPPEWQPTLVLYLMSFRKPALILSSGGKSLHAWFPVFENESDNAKFWALAIALGADPCLRRNRSQFVRMPNGLRENGRKQEVLFFDPEASQS